MDLKDIAEHGLRQVGRLTGLKPAGIVSIGRDEEGWRMAVELVVKDSIPAAMDILGVYEVKLDGVPR